MKRARYGRIVNISSGAGLGISLTGIQAYASAKAGQIGLTRQLAHELGPWNITVNNVAPGFVRSNPTTERQWEAMGEDGQAAADPEHRAEAARHARRHRRMPCCSSPPTTPAGSPARCSAWTAASERRRRGPSRGALRRACRGAEAASARSRASAPIRRTSADVARAARFVADRLAAAGFERVELHPTAGHPVVPAEWRGAAAAPTILVYGHYDVQPPDPLDKWLTPPFEPTVRDDRLYARGVSDDKGPLLIPILVAEAFLKTARAAAGQPQIPDRGRGGVRQPAFSGGRRAAARPPRRRSRGLGRRRHVARRPALDHRREPRPGRARRHASTGAGQGPALRPPRRQRAQPDPRAGRAARDAARRRTGASRSPGSMTASLPPDPAILRTIDAVGLRRRALFRRDRRARARPAAERCRAAARASGWSRRWSSTASPAATAAPAPRPSSRRRQAPRSPAGWSPGRIRTGCSTRSAGISSGIAGRLRARGRRATGRGSAAAALPPDLPALAVIEDVLEGLYGVRPLRVAMGATIPIGDIFRRMLGDRDHLLQLLHRGRGLPRAQRVLPPAEFPRRLDRLGARSSRTRRASFRYSTVTSSSMNRPSGFWKKSCTFEREMLRNGE